MQIVLLVHVHDALSAYRIAHADRCSAAQQIYLLLRCAAACLQTEEADVDHTAGSIMLPGFLLPL